MDDKWQDITLLQIAYIYIIVVLCKNVAKFTSKMYDFIEDLTVIQMETEGSPVRYKIQERPQVDQANWLLSFTPSTN